MTTNKSRRHVEYILLKCLLFFFLYRGLLAVVSCATDSEHALTKNRTKNKRAKPVKWAQKIFHSFMPVCHKSTVVNRRNTGYSML